MSVAELTSHADYIADCTHVSASMLKTFRQSPALYYGRYVSRTIPPKEDTEATLRGTLLHLSQSDPETWQDRFVIAPELAPDDQPWNRRLKKHRLWLAEFEARCEAEGKSNIKAEERERILAMAAALLADPVAGPLLSAPSVREQTVVWTDADTGLICKCRPDVLVKSPLCILDIKTAIDPSPEGFNRAIERFGYCHQQEHYRAGVATTLGGEFPDFLFIAVGSEAPHEVFVHRLDLDWQAIGTEENRYDLRRLADCYALQQWHAEGYGTIQNLSPPFWRLKRFEDAT